MQKEISVSFKPGLRYKEFFEGKYKVLRDFLEIFQVTETMLKSELRILKSRGTMKCLKLHHPQPSVMFPRGGGDSDDKGVSFTLADS